MNRYKLLIVVGIAFLVSIPLVSAEITTDIQIQDSFGLGEDVFFNYTLTSDSDTQAIIIPYIECPSAPIALILEKTITLTKNMPYRDGYSGMVVQDFFEPQTCTAYIRFLTPAQDTIRKTFTITTNPSFSFNMNFCKDQPCTEKSKVFVQGVTVYFDYSSDVDNPSITATLTYPDKTTQTLTLPGSIKAEKIGTHTLDVIASKQDYKDIKTQTQFGVIEQEANILDVSVCNANGICDNQENYQNCPQDCAYPVDKLSKKINQSAMILITIIVLFLVFLIVIISVKIFKIIRRRRFGKIERIKKLEERKKGIDLKKLELKKDFQKELKEKERTFKKKKRFLDKLSWRKKKASGKEQEVLGRKLKHDRKLLSGKKLEIKKELGKKFETKKKLLKFKETGLEKEKKVGKDKFQK